MYPADFLDAHFRHLKDAGLLYSNERWANASHLYGFAAECGLKALMAKMAPQKWPLGGKPIDADDRCHINEEKKANTWDRYQTYLSGSSAPAYSLPASPNPFGNWDASDRYAKQTHFSDGSITTHKQGAERVAALIRTAQDNGDLP